VTVIHRLRRAVTGPVLVVTVLMTTALALLPAAALVLPGGALLAWLLLGLAAGYALSGST
jgi:hypothetical protein